MKIKRISISHGRYYKGVDEYIDCKRKQRQIPLSRVDEGEAALYRAMAELDKKATQGNCPARIDDFAKIYLPTLSKAIAKEYRRVYEACKRGLAALNTEDVTAADIMDVLDQLDTPRMKHHFKSRLSTFFRWCAVKRYSDGNPCRDISISLPRSKRVEWTPVIWHQLRDKLHPMLQCYMDLCFLLYQRNTDARLLRLTQVDATGIRNTPGKTADSSGKNVTIPMTPAIEAVLQRAAELRKTFKESKAGKKSKTASIYVICKPNGLPYTASGIRATWDRMQAELVKDGKLAQAGYTSKSIRPYAASAAKRDGYSKEQIQVGLAHSSVGTTEGYLERHAEAVSVITLELPKPIKMLGGC